MITCKSIRGRCPNLSLLKSLSKGQNLTIRANIGSIHRRGQPLGALVIGKRKAPQQQHWLYRSDICNVQQYAASNILIEMLLSFWRPLIERQKLYRAEELSLRTNLDFESIL